MYNRLFIAAFATVRKSLFFCYFPSLLCVLSLNLHHQSTETWRKEPVKAKVIIRA